MSDHDEKPWDILARGAGTWEGPETMAPAPWAPDGMASNGRTEGRTILGGKGVASEYTQTVGGQVVMTGHTVIRYDDDADAFVMHFYTTGAPTEMAGRRDGDSLVFAGDGPGGPMRQTMRYGREELAVLSEGLNPKSGEWSTVFEGTYRRVAADTSAPVPGTFAWHDLTVENAGEVRDFYAAVLDWTSTDVPMGDYADYGMAAADGQPVAGVCHARGPNTGLPPVWLVYVVVADLDATLEQVDEHGGTVTDGPRAVGSDRMAVIEDPGGAVLALYEKASG